MFNFTNNIDIVQSELINIFRFAPYKSIISDAIPKSNSLKLVDSNAFIFTFYGSYPISLQ